MAGLQKRGSRTVLSSLSSQAQRQRRGAWTIGVAGFLCGFFVCYSQLLLWGPEETFDLAARTTSSSTSIAQPRYPWPGIPVEEVGNPLVQKGTNFVADSRELFLKHYDEFMTVFENRPDKINLCGIRINHAYALYLTVKVLQPTTVLESGVNAGLSTYIIRSAAPTADTKIFPIDPESKPICNQEKRWIDEVNAEYLTGTNFQDIEAFDWASRIKKGEIDPARTLVFLDDHRRVYDRYAMLMKHGFRHVVLEDNYKAREGATNHDKQGWTMKQMFSRDDADSNFLFSQLVSYAEFPPLFPPIMAKASIQPRKKAGGFMVASDKNTDIVAPIFRPDLDAEDRKIYDDVCKRLEINPTLEDHHSYMQLMNYNQFAYMDLRPLSPWLNAKYELKP